MKRPADQVKLLFFYLLRSSANALATTHGGSAAAAASNSHAAATQGAAAMMHHATPAAQASIKRHHPMMQHALGNDNGSSTGSSSSSSDSGHICLRLARRTDVPAIQRCNLATLPENYNAQFYTNHMRQWPELALVAEHIMPTSTNNNINNNKMIHFRGFPGAASMQPEPKIVAYVLGKVEDRSVPYNSKAANNNNNYRMEQSSSSFQQQQQQERRTYMDLQGNEYQLTPTGHITSLAVMEEYRRRGIAGALMDQLHQHLEHYYSQSDCVGLHVRQGNTAATQLYQRFGYHVHDVLQHYYADGEPAYLMRKPLHTAGTNTVMMKNDKNTNHAGQPMPLPRTIWQEHQQQQYKTNHHHDNMEDDDTAATVMMEEDDVEIMTGT